MQLASSVATEDNLMLKGITVLVIPCVPTSLERNETQAHDRLITLFAKSLRAFQQLQN